jgi:hypothetical protein
LSDVRSPIKIRKKSCLVIDTYFSRRGLSALITPNGLQAGVRFLLCQVTHLSANPQKVVACLVLAVWWWHTAKPCFRVRRKNVFIF